MDKVVAKDFAKGYILLTDHRLQDFILHLHLTPQGIVSVNDRWHRPRNVYDSSFRPKPWCTAINDWEDLSTEPELEFPAQRVDRA